MSGSSMLRLALGAIAIFAASRYLERGPTGSRILQLAA